MLIVISYKSGQTYDSVFGAIGSSLEECRAECVGIFLSANIQLLKVFGFEDAQRASDIMYINWLNMVRGLHLYAQSFGASLSTSLIFVFARLIKVYCIFQKIESSFGILSVCFFTRTTLQNKFGFSFDRPGSRRRVGSRVLLGGERQLAPGSHAGALRHSAHAARCLARPPGCPPRSTAFSHHPVSQYVKLSIKPEFSIEFSVQDNHVSSIAS